MNEQIHPEVAILNAALELRARDRALYLNQACIGDAALRQQVESLLKAHENAEGFLIAPPAGLEVKRGAELNISSTEKPGDRIGRYKLLQQIGLGGCGVVYLAEQEEPVRRRVALKVIKLGMDTKSVIARFEAERQALALMDHPNIAKVFDAGATETGRPYFVMELVSGVKLTDFCDENSLSTEERLKLFILVCQAIQHAHQKGIIHRDIKPSNILVTIMDGAPVPKVIDFGIAKATQGRLTDQTLVTAFEQFIGTPAYMSPEQAMMTSLDIDTRSDIYSLGVLLYELLTGRTPFDQKELLAAGLDEMRRTIREVEPIRPSTRLMSAASSASSEIRNLKPEIDRDLDWIVMRCLEKERSHRYETAIGLAIDVQRYLRNDPITACPPSRLYRFRKLVQRNKLTFAAAGLLFVAIMAIASSSTVAAWRVNRARASEQRANRDLRSTVNSLELQRAESFLSNGDTGAGAAYLAAMLRRDPANRMATIRLLSALVHRSWAIRAPVTMSHTDRIESLSFSPDAQRVLSASRDQTAKIWDASTGNPIAVLQHADQVFCAHYDASGARVVTASADGSARIWNSTTGKPLTPPLLHGGKVYWAEFSADERWIVTASADRTARIWDAVTGELKHELRKHTSHVVRARFNPDNKTVATGGSHGSIRIWSVATGEMLFRIEDRASPLAALDFSPDGSRLLSVCQDGIVRLWNLATRDEIQLTLDNDVILDAAFSPDSRFMLTCSVDATVRIWDASTGLPIGAPLMHDGGITSGQFSFDGQQIVTLSKEQAVRVWDTRTRLPVYQPMREPEQITRANCSRDGSRLVTAGREGTIHIWNLPARRLAALRTRFEKDITSLSFSSNGETLLASCLDGTARVLDSRTSETLSRLQHPAGLELAEFSPDGNRVFTAATNGQVQLWDWRKGHVIAGPFQHPRRCVSAAFNSAGSRLVTGDTDGTARVWDVETWQPITPLLRNYSALIFIPRFSPDGRFVVTAGEQYAARVWDAATGEAVTQPLLHKDHVKWADFSPDGKKIVTAAGDDTACVWDLGTGQLAIPPLQHTRVVERAYFSPDGSRVITASHDRSVRFWDARTGSALTPPLKHDYSLVGASLARDGELAMTGCWNGVVRAWDSRTGQPVTESLAPSGKAWRFVAFDPIGHRMATGGQDAILNLWQVPSPPTAVPDWFLNFTETVAGIRLGERGQVEIVTQVDFETTVRILKSKDKAEFYARVAQWFLANPADREAVPF